jgi:hypothetical protein
MRVCLEPSADGAGRTGGLSGQIDGVSFHSVFSTARHRLEPSADGAGRTGSARSDRRCEFGSDGRRHIFSFNLRSFYISPIIVLNPAQMAQGELEVIPVR